MIDGRAVGTTSNEADRAFRRALGQPGRTVACRVHVILGDGTITTFERERPVSDRENVFVATRESPAETAVFLVERLGFEFMSGQDPRTSDDLGLRGHAFTVPVLAGLRVRPNIFIDPNAEPDEIQAFDAYPVMIDLWLPRNKEFRTDEAGQQAEGRAFFDRFVAARPELPMLLTHGLDLLSAAYLPGQPVHDFPPRTLVDIPDIALWKPWVVG